MNRLIGIIDYGMGNIKSVLNALDYIGEDAEIITPGKSFFDCSHIILPGVGAYAQAMDNLNDLGFLPKIKEHIGKGKPFLGICLGMQLLSCHGNEGGERKGLGLVRGEIRKLKIEMHIPHVGWNNLKFYIDHPVLTDIKKDVDFYFVHSYEFITEHCVNLIATTDYGKEIAAIVAERSVIGMQFHPEKSQGNGLQILKNFCNWDGTL